MSVLLVCVEKAYSNKHLGVFGLGMCDDRMIKRLDTPHTRVRKLPSNTCLCSKTCTHQVMFRISLLCVEIMRKEKVR